MVQKFFGAFGAMSLLKTSKKAQNFKKKTKTWKAFFLFFLKKTGFFKKKQKKQQTKKMDCRLWSFTYFFGEVTWLLFEELFLPPQGVWTYPLALSKKGRHDVSKTAVCFFVCCFFVFSKKPVLKKQKNAFTVFRFLWKVVFFWCCH